MNFMILDVEVGSHLFGIPNQTLYIVDDILFILAAINVIINFIGIFFFICVLDLFTYILFVWSTYVLAIPIDLI